MIVSSFEDVYQVGHVSGEGGQTLLDALLIPDVRQHLVEHRHSASCPHRNQQPAHGHETEQADGFQGNRFAASVGAGNYQSPAVSSQCQGDGHGGFGIQQGVAGFIQHNLPGVGETGFLGVHLSGQLCLGKTEVQRNDHLKVVHQVAGVFRHRLAEFIQNPLDLRLFLSLENTNLVIGFHHSHGFHKEGGAAGGGIVHQAGNFRFVLRLHRHHKPAVPLGNQVFLEGFLVLGGADDFIHLLLGFGLSGSNFPAQVRQSGASVVVDHLFADHYLVDGLFQSLIGSQFSKQLL